MIMPCEVRMTSYVVGYIIVNCQFLPGSYIVRVITQYMFYTVATCSTGIKIIHKLICNLE